MRDDFKKTMVACFTGYIVQAIVNNFVPLLFLTFHKSYGIELSKITFLVTMNFAIQLLVDLISVKFVDKIGYRLSMVLAHVFSVLGLAGLSFLPEIFANAYLGIVISVFLYAVGGGLLEVLVSPVMESCPTDNKQAAMSLLHSFYCWGHVGVVLVSTAFFAFFGIQNWRILAVAWALIPLLNGILFTRIPIAPVVADGAAPMPLKKLLASKLFWILLLAMICSGACEQAVSQWASTLAEMGLGVSKAVGDLAGPLFFAACMGTSRALFGKFAPRLNLKKCLALTTVLCFCSYLIISLAPLPALSLLGCGICGFSVGILWPGTFSLAAAAMPTGGTAMFALLALGGDVGCSAGPTYVGLVANALGENLLLAILFAVIFPILMLFSLAMLKKTGQPKTSEKKPLANDSPIKIRPVTLQDAAQLAEIYSYYVKNTAITFEYDVPSTQEFSERISRITKKYPYLCAEKDGKILGYAYAGVFKDRAAYQWSVELSIYVDSSAHKCGIGKKLYTALEQELKSLGITNLYACIAVPTKEADEYLDWNSEKFHEHLGFTKVGTFTDCGRKFNRWYSMIWMEKLILTHER